jgi:hypothetical protein
MAARASSDPETRGSLVALVQVVLLTLWIGAAGFFSSVVAPASFDVLPTRELAGALVGRALPALFVAGMLVGFLSVALGLAGRREPRTTGRAIAGGAIVVACAIAQFGIAPRIATLRARLPGPLASLAVDDPLRVAFGRLHMLSVAWLGIAILAAVAVVTLAALTLRAGDHSS